MGSEHSSNPMNNYQVPEGYGADPRPNQTGVIRPLHRTSQVLPYRGAEYHGVDPNTGTPTDVTVDDVFVTSHVPIPAEDNPKDRPVTPIPVRIVTEDDSYQQKLFRTGRGVVDNTAVQILSHQKDRTQLLIRNLGTVAILVSNQEQPDAMNSWQLDAGAQSMPMCGINAIYAVSADGSQQRYATYIEYNLEYNTRPAS